MNIGKADFGKIERERVTISPIKKAARKKRGRMLFCSFRGKIRKWQALELEFLTGGVGYGLIEILWRGRTHWSMIIAGGASLVAICAINRVMGKRNILLRAAAGAFAITSIEFTVGMLVNKALCLGVWNYDNMFGNVLGQICPLYSFFWFLLCIPVLMVAKKLEGNYLRGKKVKSKS